MKGYRQTDRETKEMERERQRWRESAGRRDRDRGEGEIGGGGFYALQLLALGDDLKLPLGA